MKGTHREERLAETPVPHFVVNSSKELHGWYGGRRECTSERMLVNPYNGCLNGCVYCYAHSYAGYFKRFRDTGHPTVFSDFDKVIGSQLDSLNVAACGYLSPVADPFQRLDSYHELSLRVVREFVSRNLPIEFVTKSVVPSGVLDLLETQEDCFGQISITTLNENKRRMLMQEGATTEELLDQLTRVRERSMHVVARIDPVIPFITDSEKELKELVQRACDHGAAHVVASVMDIPANIKSRVLAGLRAFGSGVVRDLERLYREKMNGYLNADISYRRRIFDLLRGECDRRNTTFALCMEFEMADGGFLGLNREYASSVNCEGIDIPVYRREGGRFRRAAECAGNCLHCRDPLCGIEELAMGRSPGGRKSFKLADYRRWSKTTGGDRVPVS